MTRVSRRPLRKELAERMFTVFWQCFADLKTSKEVFNFLNELLSSAEKTMLAKRLAIAVLLVKGWEYSQVSSALKVSTSTVNNVRWIINRGKGGVESVAKKIISKEEMTSLISTFKPRPI